MKKLLLILSILILNSNIALAANNLVNADWWKTATLDKVKAEIANGADVNAKDNEGLTALILAARMTNNPEVIKALIKAGADVNAKIESGGSKGGTALMVAAAANKNPEVAKVLIDAGADKIAYRNNQRIHAVILALAMSNQAVVDLLLQDYKKADYSDKAEFDANFESCLATEQYHQDVKSSMSQQQQLEMFADNFFSGGRTQRQMSNDCKCIFEVIAAYLGEEKFKKTMADFEQGRYGSAKKTFRTAIPVAFLQCY